MKKLLFVALIGLFIDCKGDDVLSKECGSKNPIKNLAWLNERIQNNGSPCFSISQSTVKNTVVFHIISCGCCTAIDQGILYKCDGSLYCANQADKECQEAIVESRKNAKVIYERRR